MIWIWIALGAGAVLCLVALYFHYVIVPYFLRHLCRNFQLKPLFIVPSSPPTDDAEKVVFPTTHGLQLHGCYLATHAPSRKGVILFGLEFGTNCWACQPYCDFLRDDGYDIFAFELRGQGESPSQPGYVPLHWVTDFELADVRAALTYMKSRPDADPRGIGFFGISKGGSAGLYVACEDEYIRCCVTDGIFATHTTMVPYMQKWIFVYSNKPGFAKRVPKWYFRHVAHWGLDMVSKERNCNFPHLEWQIPKLAPKPWFAIHGDADTYIKPEMTQTLFELAGQPKELWLVEGAKHNQALQVANGEYKRRVLAFFDQHLAPSTQRHSEETLSDILVSPSRVSQTVP